MRKLKADLLSNPVYPEDWKATMKFIRGKEQQELLLQNFVFLVIALIYFL